MRIAFKKPNTDDAVVKAHFPLRDSGNPRLVYVLSERAQRIALRVKPAERAVHVVVPGLKAFTKAKAFAHEQKDWIDVQLEGLPPAQPFIDGGSILFKGQPYQLIYSQGQGRSHIDEAAQKIIVPAPDRASFANRVRRLLIRIARQELEQSSAVYADKLGKAIGKITVRDTASRWGSCITRQGKGHISYSWRLICAPSFVLDYVAAHECAHMVEANHSQAFWDVCDMIYDDVKPAKHWLRNQGALLHAVGAEY